MLDISEKIRLYAKILGVNQDYNLELNDSEECRAASAKISAHYPMEISYLESQQCVVKTEHDGCAPFRGLRCLYGASTWSQEKVRAHRSRECKESPCQQIQHREWFV